MNVFNMFPYIIEMIIFSTILKNSASLEFASLKLRDDDTIVMKAVSGKAMNLQFASKRLKNHFEIVMIAFKKFDFSLQCASEKLKKCRRFLKRCHNRTISPFLHHNLRDYK